MADEKVVFHGNVWEPICLHLIFCQKPIEECLRCQAIQRLLAATRPEKDNPEFRPEPEEARRG